MFSTRDLFLPFLPLDTVDFMLQKSERHYKVFPLLLIKWSYNPAYRRVITLGLHAYFAAIYRGNRPIYNPLRGLPCS